EGHSGVRGGPRSMNVINESGLFSLILRSDKPEAKRLKKWVTSEVLPSIRRTGAYDPRRGTPAFIKRFNANWDRVTPGYFSVINEVAVRLHGRLEQVGHILADTAPDGREIQPDGSIGSLFSKHLQAEHPTVADNYSLYWHVARMKEVQARQYPYGMLPLFLNFVDGVWIPQHSERYLRTRDPAALPYLPFLLPPPPQAAAMRGLPVPAWAKPQPARLPRPR
ncbi:BRO-N domain-containing protein, partial [Methylobacterium goesingense]